MHSFDTSSGNLGEDTIGIYGCDAIELLLEHGADPHETQLLPVTRHGEASDQETITLSKISDMFKAIVQPERLASLEKFDPSSKRK